MGKMIAAKNLIQCLIDEDPNNVIADNGTTVLEHWRHDAKQFIKSLENITYDHGGLDNLRQQAIKMLGLHPDYVGKLSSAVSRTVAPIYIEAEIGRMLISYLNRPQPESERLALEVIANKESVEDFVASAQFGRKFYTSDPVEIAKQALAKLDAKIRQKKGFYAISVGHDDVKKAHKAGILKGLDVIHEEVKQEIAAPSNGGECTIDRDNHMIDILSKSLHRADEQFNWSDIEEYKMLVKSCFKQICEEENF